VRQPLKAHRAAARIGVSCHLPLAKLRAGRLSPPERQRRECTSNMQSTSNSTTTAHTEVLLLLLPRAIGIGESPAACESLTTATRKRRVGGGIVEHQRRHTWKRRRVGSDAWSTSIADDRNQMRHLRPEINLV